MYREVKISDGKDEERWHKTPTQIYNVGQIKLPNHLLALIYYSNKVVLVLTGQ